MKKLLKFPFLLLALLVSEALTGCVAAAQPVVVSTRRPRYYRPRPARVVVVQPAPAYARPRAVIVAPAPYRRNARHHRYIRVR